MSDRPPHELDNARVLEWAWSGNGPFGTVPGVEQIEIFGLAIATYDGRQFYGFSCDKDWNVVQDDRYDSIDEAKKYIPHQYYNVEANCSGL